MRSRDRLSAFSPRTITAKNHHRLHGVSESDDDIYLLTPPQNTRNVFSEYCHVEHYNFTDLFLSETFIQIIFIISHMFDSNEIKIENCVINFLS